MAGPQVSQSSGLNCLKQWWRRSPNTCCSKKILLLLVWEVLFAFSLGLPGNRFIVPSHSSTGFLRLFHYPFSFLSSLIAPLIGFLADVKFGRYEMIKIGSLASFFGYVFSFLMNLLSQFSSIATVVLFPVQFMLLSIGQSCYLMALLLFLTDQIIGATSDELSAVVRWSFWANKVGLCLFESFSYLNTHYGSNSEYLALFIFAIPLAVIMISDCLCQQWLDRTHKVTNPIKLIIQVLNYTRKHRYPERRSAFTYIDEEQPTRMDYGKGKFGGPFTEEEVEDVKTVLRLLPLAICLSTIANILVSIPVAVSNVNYYTYMFSTGWSAWLYPLVLIPFHQLILRRLCSSLHARMLRYIGIGFLLHALGYLMLKVIRVIFSNNLHGYITCLSNNTDDWPNVDWHLKLVPSILYGIGRTISAMLILEFIIAQSPDKMKGFVMGINLCLRGLIFLIGEAFYWINYTMCCDIVAVTALVVLFVVFLVLCKRYTLRERNREINIQAIVEEHYERYMDQEEEYRKQINLEWSSTIVLNK